jgi:DNA-directed RNA polymerase subunit RPC12/RpoP
MYKCERCGRTFEHFKTPGKCPLCGVWASVRCAACGHTDGANVFINNNNRCPKCGVYVPGPAGSTASPVKETPKETGYSCPECGTIYKGFHCPSCGEKNRSIIGQLVGIGIIFLFMGSVNVFQVNPNMMCGLPSLIVGIVLFVPGIYMTLAKTKTKK